jgi:hypothetical protein
MSKSVHPGINPRTRPRETEARRVRAETVPGLGGRRGFYARPLSVSTTFSRKIRLSQPLKKRLKKQRDFCVSNLPRSPRERFGVATL